MLFIQVSLFLLGNVCLYDVCANIIHLCVHASTVPHLKLKWTARHYKYHLDYKEKGIDQIN